MANANIFFVVLKMGQTTDPLEALQYFEEILGAEKNMTTPSGITVTSFAHIIKILYQSREHPNHPAAVTKFILLIDNLWNEFKKEMKPSRGYR